MKEGAGRVMLRMCQSGGGVWSIYEGGGGEVCLFYIYLLPTRMCQSGGGVWSI